MLLIATVLPATATVDDEENLGREDKSDYVVCGSENFNLVVTVTADRKIFPRIYSEDVWATFDVLVWNEGPDISDEVNVECTVTKILVQNPGGIQHEEWDVGPHQPRSGLRHPVRYHCYNHGMFFGVYKVQATIDIDDNDPDDNTDSFIFIIIERPDIA